MKLSDRIDAFAELGTILRNVLKGNSSRYTNELTLLIEIQHIENPWFTPDNVRLALNAIANELTYENLKKWTDAYPALNQNYNPLKVGIIMAGNIPLVGFHDFLSVLISGNSIIAKTSSKDADLIRFIGDIVSDLNPQFKNRIVFTMGTLCGFDAVIATGSDNTSRYFEYYFGKYPHIIRKNRNSIAILDGTETDDELEALGTDVLSYFGLGCRNISKIFVPEKFDLKRLSTNWEKYACIINHSKYANNYDFNKAVYLVNKEKFTDTGFLLFKENRGLSSPVAVLYYENYNSPEQIKKLLQEQKEKIQCIVGKNYLPFGRAQSPVLWDYADGIDTIEFILKKIFAGIL
ncbi:MAG: acyl-CoA reductase [Bacteroidia bacterium]|nr:acyl-CoA reductase [Bacteroidia bacterium]